MIKKIAKWKGRISHGVYPICYLCGHEIKRIRDLSQDHVIPKSKGGSTTEGNLLPTHKSCNNRKGSMTVVEWFEYINGERERE